jgi:chromosome segregation ATPase
MKLAIDSIRLASAIDRQDDKMTLHSDQIQTRAQQRLQAEVDRKNELQVQIAEDDSQLVDLRDQRARLDALITKGEANLRDAKTELKAVLNSIHALESEGIRI